VERRRHELAVRAALGAGRRELRRLALRQGLVPVAFGLAGGAVAAPALGRLVSGFVPNVGAADPLVFGAAVLALAAVSSIVAFVPAQRAAGASPVEALRAE
jgi:ABC-type antimicrobial peptide transport system permease subunit